VSKENRNYRNQR